MESHDDIKCTSRIVFYYDTKFAIKDEFLGQSEKYVRNLETRALTVKFLTSLDKHRFEIFQVSGVDEYILGRDEKFIKNIIEGGTWLPVKNLDSNTYGWIRTEWIEGKISNPYNLE